MCLKLEEIIGGRTLWSFMVIEIEFYRLAVANTFVGEGDVAITGLVATKVLKKER